MWTFVNCFGSLSRGVEKALMVLRLFLCPAIFSIALASAAMAASDPSEKEIRALLDAQVQSWNHADLEGFMNGYWNSPDLTFYSAGTVTKGWQSTFERYRKRYKSGGNEMGKLAFTGLNITVLGNGSAFVRGGWQLTTRSGENPGGLFTLVLRKFPEGWRIVHDHTSAR
jgi:ketosteroid isomerase-like protein